MAALVCAAGVACLSGSSANPPKVEAKPLAQNGNDGPSDAERVPDGLLSAQKHGTAIAGDDLAGSPDDANSQDETTLPPGAADAEAPKAVGEEAGKSQDETAADSNKVQLSPYNLALPRPSDNAPDAVRAFNVAAVRAVQRAYLEDADDTSVLLALQDQLAQRPQLIGVINVWQGPLSAAMARATTLQALGPTLRALRAAMANAYFDERLRLYREVNGRSCETAFTSLPSQDETLLNFVVTVEPIGTYPLAKFRDFCAESRGTALRERQLPGRPAPAPTVKLVRRLYMQAHLGGQVRSVSVVKPWQRDEEHNQSTLRAVVGVIRSDARPGEEPCSMAEISVVRALRTGEAPVISEMGEREPILCEQLK